MLFACFIEVYIFGRGIFLIYMNVFICCFLLCSVLYMAMEGTDEN